MCFCLFNRLNSIKSFNIFYSVKLYTRASLRKIKFNLTIDACLVTDYSEDWDLLLSLWGNRNDCRFSLTTRSI